MRTNPFNACLQIYQQAINVFQYVFHRYTGNAAEGGRGQVAGTVSVGSTWWMNSADAWQIALRHTGELVKEAAEKDNGSFSLHCLLKRPYLL